MNIIKCYKFSLVTIMAIELISSARAQVLQAVMDICKESSVGLARTSDIVDRVGKKRVTVTGMLTRLKKVDVVEQPLGWGSWKLTDKGQEMLDTYNEAVK